MKANDDITDDNKFNLQNFTKIDAAFMNKNSEFLRQFTKKKRLRKIKDPNLLQRVIKNSYETQKQKQMYVLFLLKILGEFINLYTI